MNDPNPNLSAAFKDIQIRITHDGKMSYEAKGAYHEKPFELTLDAILEQVKKNGFRNPYTNKNYNTYYSEELERYAIPYMVFPYYFFVWKNMRLPTLNEYVSTYFQVYCVQLGENEYSFKETVDCRGITFTREQLTGRIARSYNSFTREIHLLVYLQEKQKMNVEYDLKLDLQGIDLTVVQGTEMIGIATYVESSRSNNYKVRKNTIRHDYSGIRMIDMRAELHEEESSTYTVNNVKLYRPEYIDRICENQIRADSKTV